MLSCLDLHKALRLPFFAPLHDSVAELSRIYPQLPSHADCNQLLTKLTRPVVALSGKPIRFVPPIAEDDETTNRYEPRIYEHGEVQTRENSWHDLFNALVWMRFPKAKAAINARHIEQQKLHGLRATRSAVQDAMTLFDESGVIVAAALAARMENFILATSCRCAKTYALLYFRPCLV
jgi:hypothetical protein